MQLELYEYLKQMDDTKLIKLIAPADPRSLSQKQAELIVQLGLTIPLSNNTKKCAYIFSSLEIASTDF
jgi:hypothetical protein